MAHMPPELIDKVCAYLIDEKKTLRSVRLVNKHLAGIGARSLFRTLLIYQRRDSWQKVISVAESASLSPYVRKIEVASLDYLPCLGSFETWRRETSDMRVKMADDMGRLAILNEDNDLIPGAELDLRLEHQYTKFLGWFDGERFLASAVDQILKDPPLQPFQIILPLLALQPFLNLRSVEMVGAYELWDFQRSKRDENAILPSFNRREIETGVFRERLHDADNKHLTLILWAVQASQCNIVTLELHHYREALASKDSPCPTLKTLKHLVLSF